jgi:sterol desaturase/sphingolipid hydroxylase (fatty acid hydroxylase superfamily)
MDTLTAILAVLADNAMVYVVAGFCALMLLEWWAARGRGLVDAYDGADTRANLRCGAGALVIGAASKTGVAGALYALHELSPLRLPADHWVTWLVAVVVLDFCLYWAHRFSHEVRIGWAIHEAHHSSRRYNLSVALRQSWTTTLLACFFIPLPLLGVPLEVLLAAKLLSSGYQFWLHTEVIGKLPRWFEAVFNTPSHHRVHHGSNPRYLDKNYGGTFIVWDRVFGTFEAERERPVYGLTKNLGRDGVLHINFHAWRELLADVRGARSWREAAAYLLRRPGWRPGARVSAGETGVAWLGACASTLIGRVVGDDCDASSTGMSLSGRCSRGA